MPAPNPFAAPEARLADVDTPAGRPGWVWVIVLYYLIGGLARIGGFVLILSDAVPLPDETRTYFFSLSPLDHALSILITCASLYGAFQLFRLRRICAYIFPGALAAGLLMTAWHLLGLGYYATFGQSNLFYLMASWAINLAICLYVWRLAKRGVLR